MNEQEQDRLFLDLYTELQEWLRFSRDLRRGIETRWKVMQERNQLVTKEFTLLVGKVSNFIPNLGRELRSLEIQKEKAAKRLTKEEKMAAIPPFVRTLSPDLQIRIAQDINAVVNEEIHKRPGRQGTHGGGDVI